MRRFYAGTECISHGQAVIRGRALRHLSTVLRLRPGDAVAVFDGTGREYRGRLASVDRREAVLRIEETVALDVEPAGKVVLVQGLVRMPRMEFIIQKTTELGVAEIYPVECERSEVHLTGVRERERQVRWKRIAEEAARQSGRMGAPVLHQVSSLGSVLSALRGKGVGLLCWEEEESISLREGLRRGPADSSYPVAIGPEGGFTAKEVESGRLNGFTPVTLGKRVLRSETAAIAAVAIMMDEIEGRFLNGKKAPSLI